MDILDVASRMILFKLKQDVKFGELKIDFERRCFSCNMTKKENHKRVISWLG